ncbi:hypothetical protein PanWU01x14_080580 [Parasponia andersonii]|uniref:Uncharacterized protein n=1 Tax=Parasponia andersonii TaxID=3476 RepID=A0A2P5DAS4_PARAD|nr:hypothetical protein PanWU01x14_080580 [Parasponia andersonii]
MEYSRVKRRRQRMNDEKVVSITISRPAKSIRGGKWHHRANIRLETTKSILSYAPRSYIVSHKRSLAQRAKAICQWIHNSYTSKVSA